MHRSLILVSLALAFGCDGGTVTPPLDDAGPIDTCSERYAVALRRPEVIVVLDRSCAMRNRVAAPAELASGPTDPEGRWGAVRAALEASVQSNAAAGWGLVLYPDDPAACDVTALRVDPGPGSDALFLSTITNDGVVDPFSVCSAGTAEVPLEAGLSTLFASTTIGSTGLPLVLVIGAGAPSCGSTVDTLASTARDLGFDVATVALSPDATAAPLLMSVGAYQEVTSAGDVAGAITAAISSASSCIFDLEGAASPEPTELRVWANGEPVLADPDQGWTYSAGDDAIAFNGALCDALNAGEITRVDAALGCDEVRCVPRAESCDRLDDDCDGTVDEDCL